MDRGAWQAIVHGITRVRHDLETKAPPPPDEKTLEVGSTTISMFNITEHLKTLCEKWLR